MNEKFEQSKLITIEEAAKDGTSGMLEKFIPNSDETLKKIESLSLDNDIKAKLSEIHSMKILSHLLRLLSQSETEKDFAIAYLENSNESYQQIESELKEDDLEILMKIEDTLSKESYDTCVFWTFAPYLYKELRDKNVESQKAIKTLLWWSRNGETHANGYNSKAKLVNLEMGLNIKKQLQNHIYTLGKNPEGASHKFTQQESVEIADCIINKDKN